MCSGGPVLGFRARLLAVCLAVVAGSGVGAAPVSADAVGGLAAQRQALQSQVAQLGAERSQALQDLLAAQDALDNIKAELAHNVAYLNDLHHQQDVITARIAATEKDIDFQRKLLATMSREQYKTNSTDSGLALIFGSQNFGQMVNRIMATNSIGKKIEDTHRKLKVEEASLKTLAADLAVKKAAADQVQAQLEQENAKEMVLVAAQDARLASIDADSKSLLGKIAAVNAQIAAAAQPRFTSGTGSGGGGASCGNHFTYGYCTWYVANRRCIPWFGNADEWWANARSYGYPEGQQAKPGAVVVWNAGSGMGSVGHVAYVESVDAGGFTVSEYNYTYGWNHYDTRYVSYSNPGPLLGFIYGK